MLCYDLANEKILLFGLDDALASELAGALVSQERQFASAPFHPTAGGMRRAIQPGIGLVFCPAETERYQLLLDFIRRERPELPVVVVSRRPEVSDWLDAIEAGAADYCSPPFESAQVRWIIENSLKYRHKAAA
jgi:DNA-binding NtrC family response regulator